MDLNIYCNYCDTQASIRDELIYMRCHCDDDHRIINLKDHVRYNVHGDYLYSMLGDNFTYVEVK